MFSKVLKEIQKYNRIIIHRHTKPDGDAIGSQVGLKHIIKENFPEKEVYVQNTDYAKYLEFLGGEGETISDELYTELLRWADDEFRSVNGQIEYLLSECVKKRRKKLRNQEKDSE